MKQLILLSFSLVLAVVLPSCGPFSGTINLPLPDRLGGGTIPITIHPEK